MADGANLESLVGDVVNLEPLPASASRLASLVVDENSHVDDIVQIINFDPALTAKLLRAANSAISAPRNPITTVRDAVVRLGPGQVLLLAIGGHVSTQMRASLQSYGLEEGRLWRHSVAAALVAESFRKMRLVRVPAESFTAALLHDVGKLLIGRHVGPEILGEIRQRRESGKTDAEAETEVLQVDHARLGAAIAKQWGLPESIVRGIALHHDPQSAPFDKDKTICDVTYLSNVIARTVEGEGARLRLEPEVDKAVRTRLALTDKLVEQLCERVATNLDEVMTLYS